MLQEQTVFPETLGILKALQSIKSLVSFSLGGGTALALRYGHRISIDLDLFSPEEFDVEEVKRELSECFNTSKINYFTIRPKFLLLEVDQVKIDILSYDYELLEKSEVIDGVKLISEKDNVCMKFSAMANRGTRKDFFDVHEILTRFELSEVLDWYRTKYSDQEVGFVVKSLSYFADAEITPEPKLFRELTWEKVKLDLRRKVQDFL